MGRRGLVLALLSSACGGLDGDEHCPDPGVCPSWDGGPEAEEPVGDGEPESEQPSNGDDGPGDGDGDGSVGGDGLPCEVRDALVSNCGMCHGSPPSFGAPMALSEYDDLRVPAPSDATRSTYEIVAERLTADVGMMPPDGEISPEDRAILLDWVERGAPEDPDASCGEAPEGGDDPEVGPDLLPCDAAYEMTAHAPGDDALPYLVPSQGADDLYTCFAFRSPFAAGMQATAWAPIIDDERVVHHWILYRASEGNYQDGTAFPCDVSLQLSADFVAGWAPGGPNTILPPDVGLDVGSPDDFFVLQVHYNNTVGYTDAFDASGVAFCATDTPRPNLAGVLTIGTTSINIPPGAVGHEETGTCGFLSTIGWPGPLHIFATSPHMHGFGRGFRTVLERLGGGTEMVTDLPVFDFESQGMYFNEPEVVVNPGDTLRSTCVFDNPTEHPVGFGEGTADEMCFNFVLAYPIDQLSGRNCGIIF
ncbi:MAG: hypothetical protein AAGF11_01430 [Myxococcota bacterium]